MKNSDLAYFLIGMTCAVIVVSWIIAPRITSLVSKPLADFEAGSIKINQTDYAVLIAQTAPQQAQGLSGQSLTTFEYEGMYFDFTAASERTFWMKDMLFAIDIFWIEDNVIVKHEANIQIPQTGEEPRTITSAPAVADAVLEMPAGSSERLNIKVGDTVVRNF